MNDNQILPACESAFAPLPARTSSPHVLVVEDDDSLRQLSTEALTRSGYEVDTAADGAAAWDKLQHNRYDLLVTDNNMPKVSGIELLRKLHAACMSLPVVMATGSLPKVEFSQSPWLQPAGTLLKPYTIEDLLHAVKRVLRGAASTSKGYQRLMPQDTKSHRISPKVEPAVTAPSGPVTSSHRILVVDEERDLRRLYAEALAGPGYAVDGAEDGAAGWEALQAKSYNLLITEHDMPKLTGVELVRKARAAHMALPVVMAAARLPADQLACNPSLELTAILIKPFFISTLLDTVKSILFAPVSLREPDSPLLNLRNRPAADSLRL